MAEMPNRSVTLSACGSLIDYESTKIKKVVHSTTMAELYALFKAFGTCLSLKGLWKDMTAQDVQIHVRTDANNLVTTAQTTRQPEQKETLHLINQLRHETCSGLIDDLSHVTTDVMMADPLTKKSERVPADTLVKAIRTGVIPNADKSPPLRELMQNKHKAFTVYGSNEHLAEWCVRNLERPLEIETILGIPIKHDIMAVWAYPDWYMHHMDDLD